MRMIEVIVIIIFFITAVPPYPTIKQILIRRDVNPYSRLSGVGALWDCVPRVCGGGGDCASGGVPLESVPALSWCGEVSLGGKHIIITPPPSKRYFNYALLLLKL
jgi:hypothetical protein